MKTFTRLGSFLMIAAAFCWSSASAQFACESPVTINCGETYFGSTAGIPNDNATSGAPTCNTTVGTGGQWWFLFTAPAAGTITVNTEGTSDYDTKLHVYTGSCAALACVVGDDDSGTGLLSSVTFTAVGGTTYLIRVGGYAANQGNFQVNVTCDLDTDGCTNPAACNYSPDAITNDGSCCLGSCRTLVVGGGTFQAEVGWQLLDAAGTVVASGGAPYNGVICATPGCGFQMVMTDTFGDGWTGNTYTITDENGTIEATGTLASGGAQTDIIALGGFTSGCTDPAANNYDPAAQCDNGSCLVCAGGESLYTINLSDAGNNGWGGATWTLVDAASGSLIDTGGLDGGSSGTYSGCLSSGCYTLITTEGNQPAQVSWQIVSISGAVVAEGGAGMNIGFPWAGASCVIPGCTNPICNNYNSNATTDDGSCVCPPTNDDCANATPIGCGQIANGTTINANIDPSAVSCDANIAVTSPGVWYTFIGTGQLVNLSTCGTAAGDTKIHVFTGDCSSPVCVTQNDDGCATGFLSSISFTAINGFAYYVLVSEFGAGVGIDFVLEMTCVDCPNGSPINDVCDNALPVPTGVDFPGNLCCANPDDDMGAWAGFGTEYGIWYVINSSDFDALNISFFNGAGQGPDATDGTDVGIGLFDGGAGCAALNPLVGGVGFNGNPLDGFIFSSSEFGLALTPNTNYYLCLTTSDPINCGDFVLNVALANTGCTDDAACNFCADCTIDDGSCEYVSCGAVTPNDLCDNATPLVCGSDIAGSTGAATNTGAPIVCPVGAGDIGVWYSFTGDGQFVNLSTCGSPIDSRITVVSSANGCAGPYTCVISEDDDATDAGCGFFDGDDASVGFVSTVGTQYYVYITAGGVDTNGDGIDDLTEGSFTLSFTCEPVVQGCQDECACNYNAAANVDNGSCDFFSCVSCPAGQNAYRFDMNDTFGDGWNGNTYSITDLAGNVVAEGDLDAAQCTDGVSLGFDILCLADGCYNMTVGGGFFTGEIGWEISDAAGNVILSGIAPNGDGTFSFTIGAGTCGCTDATACNYDAAATSDDGSCEFATCAGCTDVTACNYDADATINDATQCCYENCVTLIMNDSFGDGWNGATATILDASGNVAGTAGLPAGNSNGTASFCLGDGCFTIIVGGGTFDNEITWTLTGVTGGILNGAANDPAGIGFSTAGVNCIPGCTIAVACNYDPNATVGDCSLCDFSSCTGCTYEQAANYDATAAVDDGSCDFSGVISDCPADLDGNGFVGVSDLLIFIAAYGTICPN